MEVTVYTDGSCNAKTKLGGIGVYMYMDVSGERKEMFLSKGYSNTKTGRMEITAVILALESIKKSHRGKTVVNIFSDSQYVVNSINKKWIWNWMSGSGGLQSRTNSDLWLRFLKVYDTYPSDNVKISWVKGHAGIYGNEMADKLASKAYKSGEYDIDSGSV